VPLVQAAEITMNKAASRCMAPNLNPAGGRAQ
jgi:hypothetical protein